MKRFLLLLPLFLSGCGTIQTQTVIKYMPTESKYHIWDVARTDKCLYIYCQDIRDDQGNPLIQYTNFNVKDYYYSGWELIYTDVNGTEINANDIYDSEEQAFNMAIWKKRNEINSIIGNYQYLLKEIESLKFKPSEFLTPNPEDSYK